MKQLKIVVIGGGSSYTPELVEGIIKKRKILPVGEIVFIDIEEGKEKVQINTKLVRRMIKKAGMNTKVSYTLDRREGLKKADFVMTQIRVGGLQARALDEKIPNKYGMIGQETTGMGGFFKALRTIPVMLEIGKDMEEICPEAWLINFTNPSGIITEAICRRTQVNCIGLCNVPINMHYEAAERLEVDPKTIQTNFLGLNHLSVMNHCYQDGKDVMAQVLHLDEEGVSENQVKNIEKIEDIDLYAEELGYMLSPYLQYFLYEKEMIEEENDSLKEGKGSRAEQVMLVEQDLFKLYKDEALEDKPEELALRGGARYSEAAIALVDSIYNGKGDIQVVNTLNHGSIRELPDEASVEVNCIIDKKGATPVANGPLPEELSGLIQLVKKYETYTIEAALTGNRRTAMVALLNNPLTHSIKDTRQAFEEMLLAHKKYLPVFFKATK